ncbi:hypothetical protein [Parvimonas parva]|uniref:Uncharacterized protein n=1 Tax=Parvimonas parva TaxID=2769485 RepID=A0ABS1C6J9_9FIRM|nr:hypothetical protein [Parvimonas parva]MBK1467728.1 hypothetical protein [Parvimonas parva]
MKKKISTLLITSLCLGIVVPSLKTNATETNENKNVVLRAYENWEDGDIDDGSFSSIGSSSVLAGIISGIVLGGPVGVAVGAIISVFGLNAPVTCYYRRITQYKIKNGKMYRRYKTTFYKDSGHYEYICGPLYSEEFEIHNGYSEIYDEQ